MWVNSEGIGAMFENICDQIVSGENSPIEFEAKLNINDAETEQVNVLLDDTGIELTLKKGKIKLTRENWAQSVFEEESVVLLYYGIQPNLLKKKFKYEAQHKGQTFSEYQPTTCAWVLQMNKKKLGLEKLESIRKQLERTYVKAYLDNCDSGEETYIIRCPKCKELIDITPYNSIDAAFCPTCSKVFGESIPQEENHGICSDCGLYTKLKACKNLSKNFLNLAASKQKKCLPCRTRESIKTFIFSILAVIVIGVLNILTLWFANLYFPALIFIGVLAFIHSIYALIKMLLLTTLNKAGAATDLERIVACLRKGKIDQAFAINGTLFEDAQKDPGLGFNLIIGLLRSKDLSKAETAIDGMLSRYPNYAPVHIERLNLMQANGASETEIEGFAAEIDTINGRNNLQSPVQRGFMKKLEGTESFEV
jgi:hypothetical protein